MTDHEKLEEIIEAYLFHACDACGELDQDEPQCEITTNGLSCKYTRRKTNLIATAILKKYINKAGLLEKIEQEKYGYLHSKEGCNCENCKMVNNRNKIISQIKKIIEEA